MYWGSVRFFKHLILLTVAAMILAPTGLAVYYGRAYHNLKEYTAHSWLPDKAELWSGSLVYASNGLWPSQPAKSANPLPYQKKYPNLYIENDFTYETPGSKTVYLTFDDGPTELTPKVLDTLKEYDIKATFFIVYRDSDTAKALYKRMIAEGHTLAVHSTTHKYKEIYQSVDTFMDDFATTANMLEDVTGVKPEIFRFPGGSINSYNRSVYIPIIAEMTRRGYTYYDWNVGSGDTSKQKSAADIYNNVVNGVASHQESIVLMHDLASHESTLAALSQIIKTLRDSGYTFAPLTKTVRPVSFSYPD